MQLNFWTARWSRRYSCIILSTRAKDLWFDPRCTNLFFSYLRDKRKGNTLQRLFTQSDRRNDDGLKASYNIALLVAKAGKPHNIGETLIVPALQEIITTVMKKDPTPILRSVSLSNNTLQRRVDDMAQNVEEKLCTILQGTEFSLQLDESTLPTNECLLLAYVRFIYDGKLCQELLFARTLETDTKGGTVFSTLEGFLNERNIPMKNIIACATDGAAAMVGKYRGFTAFLKKAIPHVMTIHCVVHRQHLVAKNITEPLNSAMAIVIKSINKIKAHPLNSRLFKQLCCDNDEEFERLLLHTEVRWLSKGTCLNRIFCLFSSVVEFLDTVDVSLAEKLNTIKYQVAYLADIFEKFNDLNLQLQGDENNLVKSKSVVSSFIAKLPLFRAELGRRDFKRFPRLKEVDTQVDDDAMLIFLNHLTNIEADMKERFTDLLTLEIPTWILDPFEILSDKVQGSCDVAAELIDLRHDFKLKPIFKKPQYQDFGYSKL